MKILTIAALAATLLFGAENAKVTAPDPDKLSPAHQVVWHEVQAEATAINAELAEKELAMYRAKDAYEKAVALIKDVKQPAITAKVKKIQAEANCANCDIGPDMKWIRPPAPAGK